jgi:uncharacterized protein (DUF58 family)
MPRPVFPALWLSLRGIWIMLGCGALFALAAAAPWALGFALAGAIGFAALLVADVALGPSAARIGVKRDPVERLALRRPASFRYRIENRGPALRIGVIESPLASLTFGASSIEARIPAQSAATLEGSVLAIRRGAVDLTTIYFWTENAVGVLRRRFAAPGDERVRVFPDLSGVEEYGTLARRSTLVDAGLRRLRQRGVGTDFESVREYGSGDDFRRIEWKATARRGRLMVAQHEVERSQNVIVALDCGRLMTPRIGLQQKFDYALTAALSAARIAEAADDNVGLLAFAARPLLHVKPRRGKPHVAALTAAAYDLQPRLEEPDYERVLAEIKSGYSKRSLIVLFTDIFDPGVSAAVLSGLRILVPRHVVMCVLMNDEAVASALSHPPADPRAAYRAGVALGLADERAAMIAQLRSRGIIVVDAPASKLTIALLDAYLEVKARGLL